MRRLVKTDEPEQLVLKKVEWTATFLAWVADGKPKGDSRASIYNKSFIKDALKLETYGKCAYCECQVQGASHGDIEHIIPKSVVPERVCDWANLTLGCQVCNTKKSDYYDEDDPLLHPYDDEPEEHIWFDGPVPIPRSNSKIGVTTIRVLDLDRVDAFVARNRRIEEVSGLVELYRGIEDLPMKPELGATMRAYGDSDRHYSWAVHCYLLAELPELFLDD